jgi:hypothetical protein
MPPLRNTHNERWRVQLAVAVGLLLPGCTGDQLLVGLGKLHETRIGYHSAPRTIPRVGGVLVELLPLNNNYFRDSALFVVCIIGAESIRGVVKEVAVDPSKVVLVRADGSRIHPHEYGERAICPSGDNFRPIDEVFEFKPVESSATARAVLRSPTAWLLTDIALRFKVEAINPRNAFSLELGSIYIDGNAYEVPTIDFAAVYGYNKRVAPR